MTVAEPTQTVWWVLREPTSQRWSVAADLDGASSCSQTPAHSGLRGGHPLQDDAWRQTARSRWQEAAQDAKHQSAEERTQRAKQAQGATGQRDQRAQPMMEQQTWAQARAQQAS